MQLTSAKKLVQQLSNRSYTHLLTTGIRSTKILFYLRNHLRFVQLMHANPDLLQLTQRHPRLIYRYLGDYLTTNLSTSTKLAVLANHYKFLLHCTHKDFFKLIQQKVYLWQETHDDEQYSIALVFPFGRDSEGDLTLVFELNAQPMYMISFTFIPDEVTNFQFNQAIFVGRIQGLIDYNLIKNATKNLHDITPPALLMAALQGIALSCKTDTIIGVSNEEQLSRVKKRVFFNYDLFWESLNAQKTKENMFVLPVPFPEKPIELIKKNHRKRTLQKRQYKDEVRQEACARFHEFLH